MSRLSKDFIFAFIPPLGFGALGITIYRSIDSQIAYCKIKKMSHAMGKQAFIRYSTMYKNRKTV